MDTARKKHTASNAAHAKSDLAHARKKVTLEKKSESVSDVIQPQDTQSANVVESPREVPVSPKPVPPAESAVPAALDPLTDFKEKMTKEELPAPDIPHQKNFMWPILFIVFLVLALLAGIFIYKQGVKKQEEINVVTLSVTPTVIPEPTKAEIDLSKYQIKILNGSETEGEAGRQKDNLEGEGFIVSLIGNADDSNYTETIIQAKENVDKAFLDKLKSVLKNTFTLGEIEILSEDATTPVIIILGTKK